MIEVILGLDVNETYAQISYAQSGGAQNVETLKLSSREDETQIETLILKREEVDQWYYGAQALQKAKSGSMELIEHLWEYFAKGQDVMIEGKPYDSAMLCNLFLRRIVYAAKLKISQMHQDSEVTVKALFFTADPFYEEMKKQKEVLFQSVIQDIDQVYMISHEECLFNYMMSQPKRSLGYETGVFDFSNERFVSYRLEMNHRTKPVVTFVTRSEVPEFVKKRHYESISQHDSALFDLDYNLCSYANDFVKDHIVSTFFLVGNGFNGEWYQETLKVLCKNRKVYAGNNIYSQGAAYAGIFKFYPNAETKQYLFFGKQMIRANIGISVAGDRKDEYCPMLDAGTGWFDAQAEAEFICQAADVLEIMITPVDGNKPYMEQISFGPLDKREDAPYRLKVSMTMPSENVIKVSISDMGFGEIFAPAFEPIEKEIVLGDRAE